jgi:hypothetical protein
MAVVIERPADPVSVDVTGEKVWLRIGGHGPGEGRIAILTPRDTRILAYALLQAAESAPESTSPR